MAEPLSIASGTIALLLLAQEKFLRFKQVPSSQYEAYNTVQLEVEIYTKILEEVGQIALKGTSSLPESATLSLQLCQRHLHKLMSEIDVVFGSNPERKPKRLSSDAAGAKMVETMRNYRRSVKILRDIVMDGATQGLLNNRTHDQPPRDNAKGIDIQLNLVHDVDEVAKQVETLIERLGVILNDSSHNPGLITVRVNSVQPAAKESTSENVLEKLRRAAEGVNQQSRAAQSTPNPYQFFATILGVQTSSEESSKVCASLDTMSADNWISASIVERFGLEHLVQPAADVPYVGAGGHSFHSTGMITVLWTKNSIKSWDTDFLVQENGPFDLLLGRKFIIKEGMLVLADSVLVHENVSRLAPLSKEEAHEMEQNMRRRGAENEEITSTREALAAAARQRKREEKMASRMSLAGSRMSHAPTPGSVTPSSYQPTPSAPSRAPSVGTGTTNSNASQARDGSVDTDAGASV